MVPGIAVVFIGSEIYETPIDLGQGFKIPIGGYAGYFTAEISLRYPFLELLAINVVHLHSSERHCCLSSL